MHSTSTQSSDSDSESEVESRFDDGPVQKKRKADDSQRSTQDHPKSRFQKARTEQDELPAADDPYREGIEDCGDPFDEAIKLLTATGDSELDRNDSTGDGLKEDSNAISAPQSHENDRPHSPHMTPALEAGAVTAPQESVAAIDSQSATLAATKLMKSALDDPRIPQQVAEVANDKQE